MRYKSFRIRNFKGIQDTTVNLETVAGASVFAFVGLNESGKTTVLEAIHSFAPDEATGELIGGEEGIGVPFRERVPRHLLSEFTGDVSVAATILVDEEDKKKIQSTLNKQAQINIDIDSMPDEVVLERHQRYKRGDFVQSYFTIRSEVFVKTGSQRKWRSPTDPEKTKVRNIIAALAPGIAYFPTFVFDFPKTIFLTERGGAVDAFYRKVFQDILDYDGRGQTVEGDIVRRVRRKEFVVPFMSFWSEWNASDDRDKIQQVMDRASAAVTKLVFGKWNEIFGEKTRGKEIIISYEIIEGEVEDSKGASVATEEHDIHVKFQIRDGTRRFDVNDRSLGFRWFFSFMLFTQFRVARSEAESRPMLFLFDEPASNLHSAAQQKLIESFPEVAQNGHVLAYSTHSHYMIEPKWLEQTFIVINRSDAPPDSVLDEISLDDESLDVRVSPYRRFVDENPSQTSYFQPILDRLDVVPSRFDIDRSSVVVEGKSDYYILRYACRVLSFSEIPLIPGAGAGTFGALAALSVGWNLEFVFLLDGDKQGKNELSRYSSVYGIDRARIICLSDIDESLTDIESILDDSARQVIQRELQIKKRPSKGEIARFFQEKLARNETIDLGRHFSAKAKAILDALSDRLTS